MAFLRRTHHTQVGNNLPVTVFHDLTHTRHPMQPFIVRSEEHTSELQSLRHLVCRLLLEKTTDVLRGRGLTVSKPFTHLDAAKGGAAAAINSIEHRSPH